jgi:chromosome segregation ATPase
MLNSYKEAQQKIYNLESELTIAKTEYDILKNDSQQALRRSSNFHGSQYGNLSDQRPSMEKELAELEILRSENTRMKSQVSDGQHQIQDLIRQLDNLSRELEYLRKEIGTKDYEIQRLRTSGSSHGTIPVGSDLKEFLTQSQNVIFFIQKTEWVWV